MSWLPAVKHEIKEVGLVTLYFLFCFGIVLTLKKLFLADYQIRFYPLSAAVIGALVAAKVVVVMDHARAGTRFVASHALAATVAYKTLVYGAAGAVVVFAEELFHAYRATGGLEVAFAELWTHLDKNVILAKVICVTLAFAGYHLYAEVDRRLGEGTLRRLLWSRDGMSRYPSGQKEFKN
jgi:hypothetical protein